MRFTLPSKRTTQPRQATQLDFSNPIVRGLCAAFFATGSGVIVEPGKRAYAQTTARSNGAGVFQGARNSKQSVKSDGASTNTLRIETTPNRLDTAWELPSGQVSVLVYVSATGVPQGACPIFANADANASPFDAWRISAETGGNYSFQAAAGNSYTSVTGGTMTIGGEDVVIGTYDGVALRIYLNGVFINSFSASGAIGYPNAASRGPAVGNYYDFTGSNRSFNGDIFGGALWDRALSEAEIVSLSRNFWQIYAPIRKNLVSAAIAGGAFNPAWAKNSNFMHGVMP